MSGDYWAFEDRSIQTGVVKVFVLNSFTALVFSASKPFNWFILHSTSCCLIKQQIQQQFNFTAFPFPLVYLYINSFVGLIL